MPRPRHGGAGGGRERSFDAERRLSVRDALLAGPARDHSHDFADTRCPVRCWPAERAACAVLVDGGAAAGRAALADEVIDALARPQRWDRQPAPLPRR